MALAWPEPIPTKFISTLAEKYSKNCLFAAYNDKTFYISVGKSKRQAKQDLVPNFATYPPQRCPKVLAKGIP